MGAPCSLVADMFSFGVLLTELTTGERAKVRGQWRLPRAPDECPADVVRLIEACLASDPLQRPTARQVLRRLRAAAGEPPMQAEGKAMQPGGRPPVA